MRALYSMSVHSAVPCILIGFLLPGMALGGWINNSPTPKIEASPVAETSDESDIDVEPISTVSPKTENSENAKSAPPKKAVQPDRMSREWKDCQKGYYDLLEQRQQLVALMDHKKKNPCVTGKRVKSKKIECPQGKKFGELPADLRSQIDALMVGAPDEYPYKDDLAVEKVYPKVLAHINASIQIKCEKVQEYDN